jgi:hypothetical protein
MAYPDSLYIAVDSWNDFQTRLSVIGADCTATLPRLQAIQSRLEARTAAGKYIIEIDRKCERLLDAIMARPLLKNLLKTNKEIQALAFRGQI